MTKLKVLHLIDSLGSGGAERLLYTNLKHFDRDALENIVVRVSRSSDFWRHPIEKLGVPVESLDCGKVVNLPIGVVRLLKLIRRVKPDIIHTHLWSSNIVGRIAGKISGVPVVSSIHNPDYEPESIDDGSSVSRPKRAVIRWADKWSARFCCSGMIAVSDYVRRTTAVRFRFPLDRISVLYNPIDIESPAAPQERSEILRGIGLEPKAKFILHVGRVTPQKGLLYAIRAMPRVQATHEGVHLVSIGAAGDEGWANAVRDEISKLNLRDSVHLLGERSDVWDFLNACDVFVFPSLHEGLGIALIEALGSGCPVVATEIGPIPEFVTDNKNGLLVPSKDPASIADGILELLNDQKKREAVAKAARETIDDRFRPGPAAQALTEKYYSIVGKYHK